jgi:signal transduction histidine kinase
LGRPASKESAREFQMRLADFILANVEPILAGWEVFARSIGAGEHLDQLALRDNAALILQATARDMKSPQTAAERVNKSEGRSHAGEDSDALDGASSVHAVERLGLGFDMLEVMSEYRALRASVLQLWHSSSPDAHERDVDDLTRFNESIDQSLSKAVASYTHRVDQARDMFLAILSHDLRNPLSAIAMSAHVLPMVSIDNRAEIVECGLRITRSASVMERMISDLLDYTRTRLGAGMPVKPAPMDLAVLGRELIEEFRAAHPQRLIEFRTAGEVKGRWDSDRIRQAISNLLGNAIQHGSADFPVALSISGTRSEVVIGVHSGGDPIPPGELPKIFDPLIRGSSADHPKKNRPGSIGMGLYIAREVAKSHGGRIDVTSTVEDGTTFTIRVPYHSAPRVGQPILDVEHIEKM